METADLHNFGKSVQRIGQDLDAYYLKPRPIYWEWLFFGRNSPLSDFFNHSRLPGFTPCQVLFNLDTEINDYFSGRSREVRAAHNAENKLTHHYSLGVLLAYCYIFGIRDLHKNNVIKTDTHLQVVDAEVVFSKLLLPHETLLLPFKEVDSKLCGASHVLDLESKIDSEIFKTILTGYLDTFENVLKNRTEIECVFVDREEEMRRVPVRHILRDTFHYRDAKIRDPEIPFFESELKQLARGDVPYYFKNLGDPKVMELIDENWTAEAVPLPEAFLKGAAREATPPSILLEKKRLRNQIFPAGLLYITKTLLSSNSEVEVSMKGLKLVVTTKQVVAATDFGNFSSAR